MSRLPSRLQPWWPMFKRAHRVLTLVLGMMNRRLSPLLGERGVPRRATNSSLDTAREEPDGVTLHPGGPAEQLTRRHAVGEPAAHWRFVAGERALVPARYTLEVDNGRLVGDFGATITPRQVLDFESSGYFGINGWREHPIFVKPTLGRVERVPGTVLSLTARGTSLNYYHFLYDALARYGIFEECLPGADVDAIAVPHQLRFQQELLALAGVKGTFVEPRPGVTIAADRLLVPSTPNQALDAPPWVVRWLRCRLPASGARDLPRRLYLSRGNRPNTRRYVQEDELWPWLERRGFTRIDPGRSPAQEQIDLFHGAEVVVAPHGAGLTNITFCSPGARILEMFAPSYVHLGLWTIAEAIGDIEYRYIVGDGDHRSGRPMQSIYADVSISPTRVRAMVETMLE